MRRTTTVTVLFVLIAAVTTFAADIPDRPEKLKFPELTFDVPDAESLRFELELPRATRRLHLRQR